MLLDDCGDCLNRHVNFYLINFSEIDYFLLNIDNNLIHRRCVLGYYIIVIMLFRY